MSLIGKPIEEVITSLYNSIRSKRDIITSIKKEYSIDNTDKDSFEISKLKLIDLLDEFDITISQSLQCIQTLQAEICNLKENQQEQSFNKALSIQAPSTIQNDDSLNYQIESLVPQNTNGNNVSVITTLTNNTQVYHKPKGVASGVQKQNKLNFDYSNIVLPQSAFSNISSSLSTITQKEINNKKNSMPNFLISYNDNEINKNEDNDSEKEPEVERSRIPIRQNLYNLSSITSQDNDSSVNIPSRREVLMSKVNQIEKEKRIKKLLNKICSVKSYKTYIADKYGNGKYETFLNKINKNEINIDTLEKELKIISDLVETDLHIKNRNYTTTTHSYRSNTPKRKKSMSKDKNKVNKDEDNANVYIEPVNFANILRGNDVRKKSTSKSKKQRTFSQDKKKDTCD